MTDERETAPHRPAEEIEEIEEDLDDDNDDIGGFEGFDAGCDAASFADDFDPMQALGQLLVTQEGETIPDMLQRIHHSLDTLTKVLHKISKTLEKK